MVMTDLAVSHGRRPAHKRTRFRKRRGRRRAVLQQMRDLSLPDAEIAAMERALLRHQQADAARTWGADADDSDRTL